MPPPPPPDNERTVYGSCRKKAVCLDCRKFSYFINGRMKMSTSLIELAMKMWQDYFPRHDLLFDQIFFYQVMVHN